MEERRLLQELRAQRRGALEQMVRCYSGYVYTIVRAVLGEAVTLQDTEEVVADVFTAVWKKATALSPEGSLRGYLAATARNMAKNRLRVRGGELPLHEDVAQDARAGPEQEAERQEQAQLVRQLLAQLPERDREIFVRHYYLGQTLAAIAQVLCMPLSTVKSRLARGRKRLLRQLQERGISDEYLA